MRRAMPPLPQYAFMVWCSVKKGTGTSLTLPFTVYTFHIFENCGDFLSVQFYSVTDACIYVKYLSQFYTTYLFHISNNWAPTPKNFTSFAMSQFSF
jgi:hypothetical protein